MILTPTALKMRFLGLETTGPHSCSGPATPGSMVPHSHERERLCLSVCVFVPHTCWGPQRPEEGIRFYGAEVTRGYEPPDVGVGDEAHVLCKSNKGS